MNKTVKNSAIYLCGTIIMGVLGFVNTMLLTRVLSTQVYAMYGLLTTFVTAAVMFICFGFDSAYMRFYYNHGFTQKKYMFKSIKIPIIIFLLFVVIMLEPNHYLVNYVFENNISSVTIIILIMYVLLDVLHRFGQLTARMEERAFNYITSSMLSKSGFIVIVLIIYFIFKEVTFNWVVISFMTGCCAAFTINMMVFTKVANNKSHSETSVTTKEMFNYGYPFMINSVLVLIIPITEKLIIRDLAGWEVLGIFTAASVFQTLITRLTTTLENIWNPIVYKNCENPKVFRPILHTFGLASSTLVTTGIAAIILLRRWLVVLLDGKYHSVYVVIPAILFASCFNIITVIYGVGINIKKKTIHFVIAPIIQFIISIILCFTLIPKLGLVGVALASLISILSSRLYRIIVGLTLYSSGKSEIKSILLCIVCAFTAIASMFFTSLISDMTLSVGLIILMIIVMNKELIPVIKTIISLIKPKKNKETI